MKKGKHKAGKITQLDLIKSLRTGVHRPTQQMQNKKRKQLLQPKHRKQWNKMDDS
ncbi:MAG: hypothetical protein AB1489_26905 [Acidobacteriota bacterium]